MRELRTQENKEFERFFEVVRKEAEKEGSVFFVESGEGREIITDDMDGEDLSGWLIPRNEADEFEKEWKKNDVTGKWNKFFRFAIWNEGNGKISISFKNYT